MAQNEIQTIDLYGSPTGGTLRIELDGDVTSAIAYNASASTVDTELESLSTIGSSNIGVTGGPFPGSTMTCEFVGSLAETNVSEMTVDPSSLTGGSISASISETQSGFGALSTDITEYWTLDEMSGTRSGSYNSRSLVVSAGSPSSTTGIQSTAASFSSGDGLKNSDNLLALSTIESDFTLAGWVNLPSTASSLSIAEGRTQLSVSPWNIYPRYLLSYDHSTTRFRATIYPSASYSGTSVSADTFGAPSTSTYYFLCFRWDSSTREISIRVNDTADDTGIVSGSPSDLSGTHDFVVNTGLGAFDIDELSHWGKRLSDGEVDALYNSGSGVTYPLSSGQNTIHQLSISGSPTTGSLDLSYGAETATINYDDTAGEVDSSLEALSTIGSGNVSATGGALPGTAVDIEYTGTLANTSVALPSIDDGKLKYAVNTTQIGSPTPSQASAAWSCGPNVYSAIESPATSAWSSGDVTASGIPEIATATWSTQSQQGAGIPSSTLPAATWSSSTVTSAVLTQASSSWSSGTPTIPGVFSAPAQANWKVIQFAVLPDEPVMAFWKTKPVSTSSHPLNVPTATWSTDNAIPTPAFDGVPTSVWSTFEVTTDLNLALPTAAWSCGAEMLSPVMTQSTAAWTSRTLITPLFGDSAYAAWAAFRIIDPDLEVLSLTGEALSVPELASESLSFPEFTGEALSTPALVSESLTGS